MIFYSPFSFLVPFLHLKSPINIEGCITFLFNIYIYLSPIGCFNWLLLSRYAMNGSSQEVLSAHMAHFLSLMSDEDLGVKQSALHMCNAMVHHQPALAAPFIANTILPILCSTLTFKSERVVDLGPFKQKVDDGLPLRKASLTTIATILDIMPERFDVGLFMEPLAGALGDSEADMQILAHHVTIKLCKLDVLKSAMLCCVDVIVDPLKVFISSSPFFFIVFSVLYSSFFYFLFQSSSFYRNYNDVHLSLSLSVFPLSSFSINQRL
mmetsp:Transcript_35175/g.45351  ORF Transcript_35175/g.45351 Transcript_35175/m.45351 type:complete len:266 (-) Transcript_35175:401-1198(-)